MPTIKTKKEMNLPELIEWGFENDIRNARYIANNTEGYLSEVSFEKTGLPIFSSMVDKSDTFTVEIEEEITEDMEFKIVERYISKYEGVPRYISYTKRAIKDTLKDKLPHIETTHIYAEVDNELMLIWKNGKLVE